MSCFSYKILYVALFLVETFPRWR